MLFSNYLKSYSEIYTRDSEIDKMSKEISYFDFESLMKEVKCKSHLLSDVEDFKTYRLNAYNMMHEYDSTNLRNKLMSLIKKTDFNVNI